MTQTDPQQTSLLVLHVHIWETKRQEQGAKWEVTYQILVFVHSADSKQTLCSHALQSTQVARPSTWGRLLMDTAGRQVCYKEDTSVLTGLEKLEGPAMTALPSAGELQTGQDIGGSRSCCSRTLALHLPVGRERRAQIGVIWRQRTSQLQTQVKEVCSPSSVWPRCWQYAKRDQQCLSLDWLFRSRDHLQKFLLAAAQIQNHSLVSRSEMTVRQDIVDKCSRYKRKTVQ